MRNLLIYYTRAFEGPMHDRVYSLWTRLSRHVSDFARMEVLGDAGSHARSLARALEQFRDEPERYLLLTEADFLHYPDTDFGLSQIRKDALGVQYFDGKHRAGGWWLLIDTERAPRDLTFDHQPDPCNNLSKMMEMDLMEEVKEGPGFTYPGIGHHLFWSRHWNDPPGVVVNGHDLDTVRRQQEKIILGFQDLYDRKGL